MRFTLLRAFVVAAVLANVFYAAWSRGAFGFVGLAPATQRDPARLEQQVRPDALRVLSPAATAALTAPAANAAVVGPPPPTALPVAEGASAPTPASAPAAPGSATSSASACLEIGPLDAGTAIDGVELALVAVLPGRPWTRVQRAAGAPQYAVFVGPIMSRDAARQRREELIKLRLSFETIELPDGKSSARIGGYSLGLHDTEAAAVAALDALRERGLRNARVVPTGEDGGVARTWLRMERLSAAQADAVRALPATLLGGVKAGECVLGSVMSVRAPR